MTVDLCADLSGSSSHFGFLAYIDSQHIWESSAQGGGSVAVTWRNSYGGRSHSAAVHVKECCIGCQLWSADESVPTPAAGMLPCSFEM